MLDQLVQGQTNKFIADQLRISQRTVGNSSRAHPREAGGKRAGRPDQDDALKPVTGGWSSPPVPMFFYLGIIPK